MGNTAGFCFYNTSLGTINTSVNNEVQEAWGKYKFQYTETYVPKQVIFNNRTTVVIWLDDSKTIVKAAEGEPFIEEAGFLAALAKKVYGNRSTYLRIVENAYHQPEKKGKVNRVLDETQIEQDDEVSAG